MQLLLDECVPRRLAASIEGHSVTTVVAQGWAGTKNGVLLRQAAVAGFAVLITVDQNLPYQQALAGLPLAVVILAAADNRLPTLQALVPHLHRALDEIRPGSVVRVSADG
jgi:predicted nuclease of predicted toxin-antitoxin system